MQAEHSINQTNREEKEKNTRKKDHKQSETTLITGDSMLKNINPRGLVKKTNTIVRTFRGATVTKLEENIGFIERVKPARIGTNMLERCWNERCRKEIGV